MPAGTLRYWRATRQGPPWFRVGDRRIGYLRSDVEAWLAEQYKTSRGVVTWKRRGSTSKGPRVSDATATRERDGRRPKRRRPEH